MAAWLSGCQGVGGLVKSGEWIDSKGPQSD